MTANNAMPRSYDPDEISPLKLVNALLRHRYLILVGAALGGASGIGWYLTQDAEYTSSVSFMPQVSESSNSRLASLAGQFGIDISTGRNQQSPQFYARLSESREVLGKVVAEPFSFWAASPEGDSIQIEGTLPDLLEINDEAPEEARRRAAVGWLREEAIDVGVESETGVVRLDVTTAQAGLSAEIAARIVDLVNEFNVETRQIQASAERVFVEDRMTEARARLRSAEEELQSFLQKNRGFGNSPELLFEHDRLEREVAMQQQVYTSLIQAYEQARINEVRNIPVITVIEAPQKPLSPRSRGLALKVMLGLVMGTLLGMFLAFAVEFARRSRDEGDAEFRELERLWKDAKDDIHRVRGWVSRART